uniref:Transmembrane 9 superfamily member n=1 Tax=Pavo cristatus TaxID=9049 RepID=A0A8C9EP67_PAVCR
ACEEERLRYLLLLLLWLHGTGSFYVPGVAPINFHWNDPVEIKAVKLTSSRTQLPYEYYSLPFCQPTEITYKAENLGEVLRGDRIVNTPFQVFMNVEKKCEVLCNFPNKPVTLTVEQSKLMAERIREDYYVHLIADNLPVLSLSIFSLSLLHFSSNSEDEKCSSVTCCHHHWKCSKSGWTESTEQLRDLHLHWWAVIEYFLFLLLQEDTMEESGWKLVHGDVFRPPQYPMILSSLLGSGIQLFCMILIVIFVAMLGMLSPSSRGALMTTACFLFMFMGVFGGFFAGRLYRTLKGHRWKKGAFCTATLYPGVVFGICFVLNCFIWGKHSSGAVPFPTMVALLCMWFGISLPLVYLGYYFGFRKQPYDNPVRTNQIPRQIPEQRWYMNKFVGILMAGILPFGAMFIELFFIFSAIWENQFYYLFGFLFLVFIILVVSCSQISIVMVYFQLCAEDYRWWWRTFLVSGGSAFYVLIYAVFYFVNKLDIVEFIPSLLYFGYTALMVLSFWLLTGTIGFYAAYMFVRKIYAAVKID